MTIRLPIRPGLLAMVIVIGLTTVGRSAPGGIEAEVEGIFAESDRQDAPGYALAVVKGGETVLARGFGMADLGHEVPISPRTRFDIASVGKQFTAFAVLRLAEQGSLSIDDEARQHVAELPDFGEPITIRHLVHHTSGIRDYFGLLHLKGVRPGSDSITQADVLRVLADQRDLNFPPGEEYLYSNSGYVLLATIVERVSGQGFRDWMADSVFGPLGMERSEIGDDFTRVVPDRAEPYEPDGQGGYRLARTNYEVYGPGLTYSSVEDMARWLSNLSRPVVGSPETIETMLQPGRLNDGREIDYAFGLVEGEHRGLRVYRHNGAWTGYRSCLAWFPSHDLGIVVLSNVTSADPLGKAMAVADCYLKPHLDGPEPEESGPEGEARGGGGDGQGGATDSPIGPTPEELAPHVGRYQSPELEASYTIVLEDGRLVARHWRNGDLPLLPVAEGRFSAPIFGRIRFDRDEGGRVVGFFADADRVRGLRFDRIE